MNVSDCKYEIKQEVVDTLQSYAQHEGYELCGVLTGSDVGEKRYRISWVSPPCVKSNTRSGCERDATMANQYVKDDYERSEHTRSYIGEWHTHPEKVPNPSTVDYGSIVDNYQTATIVFPFLFMVIVGTESLHVSVYNGEEFVEIEPEVV